METHDPGQPKDPSNELIHIPSTQQHAELRGLLIQAANQANVAAPEDEATLAIAKGLAGFKKADDAPAFFRLNEARDRVPVQSAADLMAWVLEIAPWKAETPGSARQARQAFRHGSFSKPTSQLDLNPIAARRALLKKG